MSEQERVARIAQLEQEIWQREDELQRLRKAGRTRHFGDLLGIAKGMFPENSTQEELDSWKNLLENEWQDRWPRREAA